MPPRLHDLARTEYHLPSIQDFLKEVNRAIIGAFPNAGRLYSSSKCPTPRFMTTYDAVNCLLIHWEDDDLGVVIEIDRLQRVLVEHYQYCVECYSIPSKNSHRMLERRLRDFTEPFEENNNVLLIVYYGGHGYLNANRQHIWVW
jgi:hypothetical protein